MLEHQIVITDALDNVLVILEIKSLGLGNDFPNGQTARLRCLGLWDLNTFMYVMWLVYVLEMSFSLS